MCRGSKLAITIGRCRRHASPLAENTPLKPMSSAIALRRSLRWKPSGRSRSSAAIVSGFATEKGLRADAETEVLAVGAAPLLGREVQPRVAQLEQVAEDRQPARAGQLADLP